MSGFTFLTEEQCDGSDKLDILKKRGTKAEITDFSILLGGLSFIEDEDYHKDNDNSLEGKTGFYWTKSEKGSHDVLIVDCDGHIIKDSVGVNSMGARPALPFSSIGSIPTNGDAIRIRTRI